jgi:anti-sigma factor RsiW
MSELFTGELRALDRLELEAHADRCARCDAALRDLATISVALDRAYAPLRRRGTLLSPARVRLAARGEPRSALPWWRVGYLGRLSEATMALGFAALVLGGALDLVATPPTVTANVPSVIRDYFRARTPADEAPSQRWVRLQLRAIGVNAIPTAGYSAGTQLDVESTSYVNDWLSPDGQR